MSDVSEGVGWWLASDGKWYPPEPASAAPPQSAPERRAPAHMSRRPPTGRSRSRQVLLGFVGLVVVAALVIIAVVAATGGKKHKSGAASPGSRPPTPTTAATVGAPVSSVQGALPPATPPIAAGGPLTTSPTATPAPASTSAAPPIALSGIGNSAPSFNAAGGLTVLTAQYKGPNTFSLGIIDDTGQSVDTPVSTVGAYTGTVSEALNPGHYTLNVTATTAWTVTITQPRNQQAFKLPYVFNNGGGDALIGPFRADGPYQITATARGASFMLIVLDTSGYERDIPINQVGPYSGSVAEADVTPGNYYLQVNSSGSWTINVSSL
jgi:hypothetical protein